MLLEYIFANDCAPSEVHDAIVTLLTAGQKALTRKPQDDVVNGLLGLEIEPLLALCAECALADEDVYDYLDGEYDDDEDEDDDFDFFGEDDEDEEDEDEDEDEGEDDDCNAFGLGCMMDDDSPFVQIDMGAYIIVANADECHIIPKDGVEMEHSESKFCPDDDDEDD